MITSADFLTALYELQILNPNNQQFSGNDIISVLAQMKKGSSVTMLQKEISILLKQPNNPVALNFCLRNVENGVEYYSVNHFIALGSELFAMTNTPQLFNQFFPTLYPLYLKVTEVQSSAFAKKQAEKSSDPFAGLSPDAFDPATEKYISQKMPKCIVSIQRTRDGGVNQSLMLKNETMSYSRQLNRNSPIYQKLTLNIVLKALCLLITTTSGTSFTFLDLMKTLISPKSDLSNKEDIDIACALLTETISKLIALNYCCLTQDKIFPVVNKPHQMETIANFSLRVDKIFNPNEILSEGGLSLLFEEAKNKLRQIERESRGEIQLASANQDNLYFSTSLTDEGFILQQALNFIQASTTFKNRLLLTVYMLIVNETKTPEFLVKDLIKKINPAFKNLFYCESKEANAQINELFKTIMGCHYLLIKNIGVNVNETEYIVTLNVNKKPKIADFDADGQSIVNNFVKQVHFVQTYQKNKSLTIEAVQVFFHYCLDNAVFSFTEEEFGLIFLEQLSVEVEKAELIKIFKFHGLIEEKNNSLHIVFNELTYKKLNLLDSSLKAYYSFLQEKYSSWVFTQVQIPSSLNVKLPSKYEEEGSVKSASDLINVFSAINEGKKRKVGVIDLELNEELKHTPR